MINTIKDQRLLELAVCRWLKSFAQAHVNWFTHETDDSLGFFPLETTHGGDYICPKCGKVAEYWEGIISQDRMGNDIRGWSYDCFPCKIGTMVHEF
jgi:hypothetical protein